MSYEIAIPARPDAKISEPLIRGHRTISRILQSHVSVSLSWSIARNQELRTVSSSSVAISTAQSRLTTFISATEAKIGLQIGMLSTNQMREFENQPKTAILLKTVTIVKSPQAGITASLEPKTSARKIAEMTTEEF